MPRGVYERSKSFDVTEAPQNALDVDAGLETPIDQIVQEVEPVTNVYGASEKAAKLAFYEEPVRIFVYEGSGANDEKYIHLQNNGENVLPGSPYLPRGCESTIKRKFVEQLASMRPITYSQPYKGTGSEQENIYRPQVSVRYPFSIVHDANPQGAKWIKSFMGK